MKFMQTVILAAGSGERFHKAGYKQPKALIPVLGDPMLNYPIELVRRTIGPSPIVVCSDGLTADCAQARNCPTLWLQHMQRGPALSLLCINGRVADDDPVLVMACDDRIEQHAFAQFAQAFQKLSAAQEHTAPPSSDNAIVMTTVLTDMREATDRFAYVQGNGSHVQFIKEKRYQGTGYVISPPRIFCGVIGFKRWDTARLAIMRMICESAESVNGEYFVAPCVNLITRVRYFDIPRSAFVTVGTPEELRKFEEGRQS